MMLRHVPLMLTVTLSTKTAWPVVMLLATLTVWMQQAWLVPLPLPLLHPRPLPLLAPSMETDRDGHATMLHHVPLMLTVILLTKPAQLVMLLAILTEWIQLAWLALVLADLQSRTRSLWDRTEQDARILVSEDKKIKQTLVQIGSTFRGCKIGEYS